MCIGRRTILQDLSTVLVSFGKEYSERSYRFQDKWHRQILHAYDWAYSIEYASDICSIEMAPYTKSYVSMFVEQHLYRYGKVWGHYKCMLSGFGYAVHFIGA